MEGTTILWFLREFQNVFLRRPYQKGMDKQNSILRKNIYWGTRTYEPGLRSINPSPPKLSTSFSFFNTWSWLVACSWWTTTIWSAFSGPFSPKFSSKNLYRSSNVSSPRDGTSKIWAMEYMSKAVRHWCYEKKGGTCLKGDILPMNRIYSFDNGNGRLEFTASSIKLTVECNAFWKF